MSGLSAVVRAVAPPLVFEDATDTGGARWVTIGGRKGEDGEEHKGGFPVQIGHDGTILKGGPKFLQGKKVSDAHKHFQRSATRKKTSAAAGERRMRRGAKDWGMTKDEYENAAEHVWKSQQEHHGEREAAKEYARKRLGIDAGHVRRLENQGQDYSSGSIKGLDTLGREMASMYPALGWGGGYGDESGHEHDALLWELLKEGKKTMPARHSDEYHAAVDEFLNTLANASDMQEPTKKGKGKRKPKEDDSFDFGSNKHGDSSTFESGAWQMRNGCLRWVFEGRAYRSSPGQMGLFDESKHPRDHGKFSKGHGGGGELPGKPAKAEPPAPTASQPSSSFKEGDAVTVHSHDKVIPDPRHGQHGTVSRVFRDEAGTVHRVKFQDGKEEDFDERELKPKQAEKPSPKPADPRTPQQARAEAAQRQQAAKPKPDVVPAPKRNADRTIDELLSERKRLMDGKRDNPNDPAWSMAHIGIREINGELTKRGHREKSDSERVDEEFTANANRVSADPTKAKSRDIHRAIMWQQDYGRWMLHRAERGEVDPKVAQEHAQHAEHEADWYRSILKERGDLAGAGPYSDEREQKPAEPPKPKVVTLDSPKSRRTGSGIVADSHGKLPEFKADAQKSVNYAAGDEEQRRRDYVVSQAHDAVKELPEDEYVALLKSHDGRKDMAQGKAVALLGRVAGIGNGKKAKEAAAKAFADISPTRFHKQHYSQNTNEMKPTAGVDVTNAMLPTEAVWRAIHRHVNASPGEFTPVTGVHDSAKYLKEPEAKPAPAEKPVTVADNDDWDQRQAARAESHRAAMRKQPHEMTFDEFNRDNEEAFRQTHEPETPGQTMAKLSAAKSARTGRVADGLAMLPDGMKVNGWTKITIPGEHGGAFFESKSGKGGMSARQFAEKYRTEAAKAAHDAIKRATAAQPAKPSPADKPEPAFSLSNPAPKPKHEHFEAPSMRRQSLFDTSGKAGQMNLFADKAVPDSLLPKHLRRGAESYAWRIGRNGRAVWESISTTINTADRPGVSHEQDQATGERSDAGASPAGGRDGTDGIGTLLGTGSLLAESLAPEVGRDVREGSDRGAGSCPTGGRPYELPWARTEPEDRSREGNRRVAESAIQRGPGGRGGGVGSVQSLGQVSPGHERLRDPDDLGEDPARDRGACRFSSGPTGADRPDGRGRLFGDVAIETSGWRRTEGGRPVFESADEHWITIGGSPETGADGHEVKHAGGFRVKLNGDGKIMAGGPSHLRGVHVTDVKEHFDKQRGGGKSEEKPAEKSPERHGESDLHAALKDAADALSESGSDPSLVKSVRAGLASGSVSDVLKKSVINAMSKFKGDDAIASICDRLQDSGQTDAPKRRESPKKPDESKPTGQKPQQTPASAGKSSPKESWQKTHAEVKSEADKEHDAKKLNPIQRAKDNLARAAAHEKSVEHAVHAGKDVPDEVLKDYPHLRKKFTKPNDESPKASKTATRDVTPHVYGPTEESKDSRPTRVEDSHIAHDTDFQKLRSSINEAKTALRGKLPDGQRKQIEAKLKENESKLAQMTNGKVAPSAKDVDRDIPTRKPPKSKAGYDEPPADASKYAHGLSADADAADKSANHAHAASAHSQAAHAHRKAAEISRKAGDEHKAQAHDAFAQHHQQKSDGRVQAEKSSQERGVSAFTGKQAKKPVSPQQPVSPRSEQPVASEQPNPVRAKASNPNVAQPTPMRSVTMTTQTLSGPKQVRGKVYAFPNYEGPELAVAEYKSPRGSGYRIYLADTGAILNDNNGVGSLGDAAKIAIQRISNAAKQHNVHPLDLPNRMAEMRPAQPRITETKTQPAPSNAPTAPQQSQGDGANRSYKLQTKDHGEVDAEDVRPAKIAGLDEHEFVSHKAPGAEGQYTVTHAPSGLSLTHGASHEEALKNAHELVNRHGVEKVKQKLAAVAR